MIRRSPNGAIPLWSYTRIPLDLEPGAALWGGAGGRAWEGNRGN